MLVKVCVVGSKLVPNPRPMAEGLTLSGAHGSFASFEDGRDALHPLSHLECCSTMTSECSSRTATSPSSAGVLQRSRGWLFLEHLEH